MGKSGYLYGGIEFILNQGFTRVEIEVLMPPKHPLYVMS